MKKELNLWELNNVKGREYTNDINRLIELIRLGQIIKLNVQDRYEAGNPSNSTFEDIFAKKNVTLNYVDNDHPILISHNPILSNIISTKFYKEHEKKIKEAFNDYYANLNEDYVSIPKVAYSPELIDILISKKVEYIDFYDVELTSSDIEKLQDNFISASIHTNGDYKKISSNYVIGVFTKEMIEKEKTLLLTISDLEESNFDNVKYLNDNSFIQILNTDFEKDEETSYLLIKDLIEHLSKSGKHFNISFHVYNRSVFGKVFNEETYNNVDIVIRNDLYDYSYLEYLEEEDKLDKLVEPIKKADLTPLERYLAVYNLVKNFKPYKESPDQLEESRYIRYILDNEYMVCVGYAKLLEVLCDKVGIKTTDLSITVDTSYDKYLEGEEKLVQEKIVEQGGHARCMVSIDDDKYDVHGVYIADPTWDNELSENRLNHALMTFSKTVTGKRMTWFSLYEPILDINTFDDFNRQVNYLLKRYLKDIKDDGHVYLYDYISFDERVRMENDPKYKEEMTNKAILLLAYKRVIKNILEPLSCEEVQVYLNKVEDIKTEDDFIDLLTDIGNYLLTRINQPISNETLIQASTNGTAKIKRLNKKEREIEYSKTRKNLYDRELTSFPYMVEESNKLGWKSR